MTVFGFAVLVVALACVLAYARWSGWGFGLGWWGRPMPARVLSVDPLEGALMKGGAPWAMDVARQRGRGRVEVHPPGGEPYTTTTIVWQVPTTSLAGQEVTVRVSRTRPGRVLIARSGTTEPSPTDPASGHY